MKRAQRWVVVGGAVFLVADITHFARRTGDNQKGAWVTYKDPVGIVVGIPRDWEVHADGTSGRTEIQ